MNNLKEVDWSKSPEGATHYNAKCPHPWLKETPLSFYYDGGWIEYRDPSNKYAMNHFLNAVKRPEWDGSGVPPVGTVCEYQLNGGAWFKCKIIYTLSGTDDCFVAWCEHLNSDQFLTFSSRRYKLQLRKIKTPEQLATEERLDAIEEMSYLTQRTDIISLGCFRALYDAGYRKTEDSK